MKRVIVKSFIVIAAMALVAGCGKGTKEGTKKEEPKGEVLVTINGKAITMEEFNKEQEKLPPYIKASMATAEGKKQFLDNLITRELILQKAEKTGMAKDESVNSKLEEIKKTLMIEALLKKEIEGKFAFTEKDAEAYYNAHKDEFKEGDQVKIAHIMVKTEKEANDILKKLQKKEKFEKLAQKHSAGPTAEKGGELGYIQRGQIAPEFEEAAFKLKKAGEISPVISAKSGFHIIKLLEDKKDAAAQPFDMVKDKIITAETKKKQKELFEGFVNSLKKEAKLEMKESLFKDEEKKDEAPGAKKEEIPSKEEKK